MLWKLLKWTGVLLAVLLLIICTIEGYGQYVWRKTYDPPVPHIARATSPEALARGQKIFMSHCAGCHIAANDSVPAGGKMEDVPAWICDMVAANLTSDKATGIGALSDEDIVRKIVYAVGSDRHVGLMSPNSKMSDDDIAAVLGFVRSDHPLFRPITKHNKKTSLTMLGAAMIGTAGTFSTDPRPAHIASPQVGPTAEYGAYWANGIIGCADCHTAGFASVDKKLKQPNCYGGGFEFGNPPNIVYSANITPAASGIGTWTEEQFIRALRDGIRPDTSIVRAPMPCFRYFDDMECRAIYAYLKTLKAVDVPLPPSSRPSPKVKLSAPPESMFVTLGCVSCHGPDGQYRAKLKQCVGKPIPETAAWILHPEKTKPGTQMPTFAYVIGQDQADQLARFAHAEAERIK